MPPSLMFLPTIIMGYMPCSFMETRPFRYSSVISQIHVAPQKREPFPHLPAEPKERASIAFALLAKKDRSRMRFRHMVDLAVDYQYGKHSTIKSIVDVGTDHGLLAGALAITGCFEKVLGVDVSSNALSNGGFELLSRLEEFPDQYGRVDGEGLGSHGTLPLDFRLSDGLEQVQIGEADSVCIAGMGVNVMNKILSTSMDGVLNVDRLQCQQLILQPTNSRPRNLMMLYQTLQVGGWVLQDERIEKLSGRWYISSIFVRPGNSSHNSKETNIAEYDFPTSKLALLPDKDNMKTVTKGYWAHHLKWIQGEKTASGGRKVRPEDTMWRDWVNSLSS